ncbi:YncE family protein [Streptomyces sediminimaris]|uniref:YncE family protein n=1 Tax=Streptomyces sediminimaris TaxID=3383721 RepID=UPI003999AA30
MPQTARAGRTGDVVAVVSQSGPTVSFFDAVSDRHLDTVETLAEPHELCFDPTHRLLWCANTYRGGYYHANAGRRSELTVIDPDTRQIVEVVDLAPEHGPHGLALDVARGRLYVSVEGSRTRVGGVVIVDTATRRVLDRIDTEAPGPHWFVASPDGMTGYASNKEAPFVSVVDLLGGTLTDRIEVPGGEGLAVSQDGARVYLASPYASFGGARPETAPGIRVIDTKTRSVVETLPTDDLVVPVHLTTTGKLLAGEVRMASGDGSGNAHAEPGQLRTPGQLTVFSAESHEKAGSIDVGRCPLTIISSPDGALGYVASVIDSTVHVIDLDAMSCLARLDIAKLGEPGAHGLAYIPRAA